LLGGTEENHKKPQDSWSLCQDLNLAPPDYKALVLTSQPQRSVFSIYEMDKFVTRKKFIKQQLISC
jgi:hypothetical protein